MSSILEYTDDNGQVIRGIPVVIIDDRSSVSASQGSKTDFIDVDGHKVHATPLIIVEDYRTSTAPGTGTGTPPSSAELAAKQDTLVSGTNIKTVAGKSLLGAGNVTLLAADISNLGTAATRPSTDFASSAQGLKADTALQTVPVATSTVLGGVKQGSGVTIAADGTLSASGVAAAAATTISQGLIQLAGDLAGTATAPTVPALANKQATLVSGTNIKTVGGQSLLGAGDIPLPAAGSGTGASSFSALSGVPSDNAALSTALATKVDKAVAGNTVTVSGNMASTHIGKVIVVDTSSTPVVLTLVPGVITSASDRITYKRKGGNALSFAAANGATLNDPHLMQIIDGDLAVIAGTALDTATVVGMPGDLVRKTRANLYTARQAIAPATLAIIGGNIPVDASLSNNFTLSLTANATLSNPTALVGGQAGTIDVVNTGAFNLSFGTMWRPVVGATTAVKQGAGGFSIITFKVSADGTKILFNIIQEQ